MNPWPFVTAAYALTGIVSVALALWSFLAMRGSEKK
ncbi:hypothetical protein ACVWYO_001799 [Sphingomonas sp. UYP23]